MLNWAHIGKTNTTNNYSCELLDKRVRYQIDAVVKHYIMYIYILSIKQLFDEKNKTGEK